MVPSMYFVHEVRYVKNSLFVFSAPSYVRLILVLSLCLAAVCGCGNGDGATKPPVVIYENLIDDEDDPWRAAGNPLLRP